MNKKTPDFELSKEIYRKLRLKITFPEKRWLMDAISYEDYIGRMRELAKKHKVKID